MVMPPLGSSNAERKLRSLKARFTKSRDKQVRELQVERAMLAGAARDRRPTRANDLVTAAQVDLRIAEIASRITLGVILRNTWRRSILGEFFATYPAIKGK